MSNEEAAVILEQHNLWRRGSDDIPQTNPTALGKAIEVAVKALRESGGVSHE